MKDVCLNPRTRNYANFGGRGIKIHPPWVHSFACFLADVGRRPAKGWKLTRINQDGDFTPENCEWRKPEPGLIRTHKNEYTCYQSAKGRCTNPHFAQYEFYGGSGIKFLYKSFREFLDDLGPRPGLGYTLDRIDPTGHYEPGNCKWSDGSEQRRNSRRESHQGYSRFKGVHFHRPGSKWRAMISVNNRTVDLGMFTDERKAAEAYDKAALRSHGKRAVTNAMLGRF